MLFVSAKHKYTEFVLFQISSVVQCEKSSSNNLLWNVVVYYFIGFRWHCINQVVEIVTYTVKSGSLLWNNNKPKNKHKEGILTRVLNKYKETENTHAQSRLVTTSWMRKSRTGTSGFCYCCCRLCELHACSHRDYPVIILVACSSSYSYFLFFILNGRFFLIYIG